MPPEKHKRRKLTRLIAGLLVLTMLLGGAGLAAWRIRRARHVESLLDRAAAAEAEASWGLAESLLRRASAYRPQDAELCGRIGFAIEQGDAASGANDSGRALPFYAKSLRLEPNNAQVRLRLAALQLDAQPQEALNQAAIVLAENPADPGALRIRALGTARLFPLRTDPRAHVLATWQLLETAVQRCPGDIRLATTAAQFAQQHAAELAEVQKTTHAEIQRQADRCMDQLVRHAEDESAARMQRLLYRRKYPPASGKARAGRGDPRAAARTPDPNSSLAGSPPADVKGVRQPTAIAVSTEAIREDLERLLEREPSSSVIRLLAAGVETREAFADLPWNSPAGSHDTAAARRATEHLRAAIDSQTGDLMPVFSLAQLQWWCGEREQATRTLAEGIRTRDPRNPMLNFRLAETAMAVGQWELADEALCLLEQSTRSADTMDTANPPVPVEASPFAAETNLAAAEMSPAAAEMSPAAAEMSPAAAEMGRAEWATRRAEDELAPLVQLLRVQWWLGVGNPLRDPQRAERLLEPAEDVSLSTGLRSLAWYLRGLARAAQGDWPGAESCFEQACRVTGSGVLPELAAASAISRQGRFQEAVARYRRVLQAASSGPNAFHRPQVGIEIARCTLAEQAGLPPQDRQWRVFQETLNELRTQLPDSPIPWYLELRAARLGRPVAEGRGESELLREGEERFADAPEFWRLVAEFHLQSRQHEAAARAVARAVERIESLTGVEDQGLRREMAIARGDVEAADRLLDQAISEALPFQRPPLVVRRAQLLMGARRFDRAEAVLHEGLGQSPGDLRIRFQLGQLRWLLGDADGLRAIVGELASGGASESAEHAICDTQLQFLRHVASRGREGESSLRAAAERLARDYPLDRRGRVLQGLVAQHLGDDRQAAQALREALELGERDPQVLLRLSTLLQTLGRHNEALDYCLLAAPACDDCRPAALAATLLTSGRVSQDGQRRAEELFASVLRGGELPGRDLFLMNLANLREKQGRIQEAVQRLREALQRQPDSIALQNNLAWFLSVHEQRHDEARALIDQAIRSAGELPTLLDTRGMILLNCGRAQEAVEVLERAVQNQSPSPERRLHLADAYFQSGRTRESARTLALVEPNLVDLSPGDRRVFLRLKAALP